MEINMNIHHNGIDVLLKERNVKGEYYCVLPHTPSDNSLFERSTFGHVKNFHAESLEEAVEQVKNMLDESSITHNSSP